MKSTGLVVVLITAALLELAATSTRAEQPPGKATEIQGMVRRSRAVDLRTAVSLATEAGTVIVSISEPIPNAGSALVGAVVRVRGYWAPLTSDRGVAIGRQFVVPAAASIEVLEPAVAIAELPHSGIGEVLTRISTVPMAGRAKVRGIVTRASSRTLYITDANDSIQVATTDRPSAKPGDIVEVAGFPGIRDYRPLLIEAEYTIIGSGRIPDPMPVTAQQVMRGIHQAALVKLEGTVTASEEDEGQYEFLLKDEAVAFEMRVPALAVPNAAKQFAPGSRVVVVGVCRVVFDGQGRARSFRIYPRSAADIVTIRAASPWTNSNLFMVLGAGGAVLAIAAGWIVLLRRRIPQTERALQQSEERYREIFERSPAGSFITRADGSMVACNDRFARILGFAGRDEAMAINASQLYRDPMERAHFLEMLSQDGAVEQYETTLIRADGSPLQVLESAIGRFDAAGRLIEVEGYMIDLTRQKLAEAALHESEAQLRQSQRMEGMGRLAGGIAHDFNNLLTAILGFSELLLQGVDLDAGPRRDVEQIRRSAQSAASLTRHLLAFSRKQVLNPATLDLNLVVADVAAMLRRVLGEDVALNTSVLRDPAYVLADRGQLEQVLMNLAVNARDAMPHGGRLDIAVRLRTSSVVLEVRDSGCGIPAAVLPHIFEPFFTTKPVGEGTGLGLATVYGIVTQSGGEIEVESSAGKGTAFSIRLPRFAAAAPTVDDPTPVEVRGQETILVVEDEPVVRTFVRATLERYGYRVVLAEDAVGAIIAIQRSPDIAMVLSDVVMPRMNGSELISKIRALKPDVKVILMSGYTARPGCQIPNFPADVPFLQKPFTPVGLAAMVRGTLDAGGRAPKSTPRQPAPVEARCA